jgi:glycosyltransferase involved in cell wall biosynthesis/MoaA/NifB/PqqE/SkfB family radical SAM enzyme
LEEDSFPRKDVMKVLQVIHGYPMRYNAGSEVYTQTLVQGLAARHDVQVFTREEDPFASDYSLRGDVDPDDARVRLHLVNMPRSRDRYRHAGVDGRFTQVLESFRPDIVHVGHLNHLSTSILAEAAAREIPIVYTLHDYWLMCPRGQFMQMHPVDPEDLWAACDGQDDRKCAERCYSRYFSGTPEEREEDVEHWSRWVGRRMAHMREMTELVDLFIAPARYLLDRFRRDFGLPARKVTYLDYGFELGRLRGRRRDESQPFTFGYIGTHVAAKGIHQLLAAFGALSGESRLRIWGRHRGQETEALRAIARGLPGGAAQRVEWLPEYRNQDVVRDVFDHVDAIVVPSVWVENSPLVIHEALQARVPVITADVGGMAEYVRHEQNGLLFRHRDAVSLSAQMQRLACDRQLATRLGQRGYVQSDSGDIPDIGTHVAEMERIYEGVLRNRHRARIAPFDGPWRITFDTNPDTCNLRCIMCEEHSPLSDKQEQRKGAGTPRRVMPMEILRRVIAEAAANGLREVIPSTMGEPLLYEHFDEIIDLCVAHGVKLNLTTNGTFPGRGVRAWAERVVPVSSDVKISWNGATKETHERIMLGVRWETVLENVRTFVEMRDAHAAAGGNRCRVTLQLTFMETNIPELADIVRLAIDLGVDRVKGHHLWAHFDGIKSLSMRRDAAAIRRWNTAVAAAETAAQERLLPNGKRLLLENIVRLDETAPEDLAPGGPCPFLGKEAWVSAEGRFDPCCAPDAQRRTLGELGNLSESGLMQIWRGEPYRRLVATHRTRALCLGCNMRKQVRPT